MKKMLLLCVVALLSFGYASADEPKKGDNKLVTTVFETNIDCAGCAKKVNNTIPYEKGVKEVKVDVEKKTVTVTYDSTKTNDTNLVKAFTKIKIEAEPQKAEK
jgi:copper chaperone CopZ